MKLLGTILLAVIYTISAQQLYEQQITPFDGMHNDFFGRSIAVSDSFLFVGSLRYSNHIENAVYVYREENNDYIFQYKLFTSDTQTFVAGALFGSKLLYEDSKLFVCAPNKIYNGLRSGSVYLFEDENYKWVEKQKITPPWGQNTGRFSTSISRWNDYLLIGAPRYGTSVPESGMAFLYRYLNENYELFQEFSPFDGVQGQGFGGSVYIKENLILIGSSADSTESGLFSGSVYAYYKDDSLWSFKQKYLPEPNSEFLAYGCDIVLNNDFIFIGTTDNVYYSNPGKVYIYKYSGYELDLSQIIESGDNYFDDRFGINLYASEDSLLVGAIFDTVKNEHPGTVYLFINKNGRWIKEYKIYPSDEENASWFGGSITLKSDNIFIGAHQTLVNNIDMGAVYRYSSKPLTVINDNFTELNEFYLSQNYPNPFNSNSKIDFYIPKYGRVKIKVYDIRGRELKVIIDERKQSGYYEVSMDLKGFPSGVYFYQIEYFYAENNYVKHSHLTKKAVLIK